MILAKLTEKGNKANLGVYEFEVAPNKGDIIRYDDTWYVVLERLHGIEANKTKSNSFVLLIQKNKDRNKEFIDNLRKGLTRGLFG